MVDGDMMFHMGSFYMQWIACILRDIKLVAFSGVHDIGYIDYSSMFRLTHYRCFVFTYGEFCF
jgi:hypothetical protein